MTGARELSTLINEIASYPAWSIRVATQDWHPKSHISFASNHSAPNNVPFNSRTTVKNPHNPSETRPQRLWPDHCIQGSTGAEIIQEIDKQLFDLFVKKGMNMDIEMYSAFADGFDNMDCIHFGGVDVDLANRLYEAGITDVYCVGVAGDYCVKDTAISAAKAGFKSFVIEDLIRCVDPEDGWPRTKTDLKASNVTLITTESEEVKRLRKVS